MSKAAVPLLLLLVAQAAPPSPDRRLDALASLAEAKMKEYGVPGVAIGVMSGGDTAIRGLGVTNVDDPLPVTAHTVYPIASISKTFAATAMMRLVEQGKVDLKAPVRTYLPDFKVRDEAASRDATVWHLLTHLGGWEGQVSGPERGADTLRNFVAATLPDLMQIAPPGKAWSYNNAGFSIAGRVIETVTGTSINQAMRDLVFRPLALEHAGTTAGDFIVSRFASGHLARDGRTTLQRPFTPSTSVTAGGVGLCITDLLAYAKFHLGDGTAANGDRVLQRASLEQMRAVQAHKQGTDDDIGLAWHIRQVGPIRTLGHGGTLGGHILLLEIVPERNFAIAILTNANSGWRLIQDVEREALKSYLGAAYAPNQAIAHRGLVETLPTAEPLAQQPDPAPYLGTYARPSNSYVVRAEGGRLVVQDRSGSGGTPREWPVAFFGPDRLVVTDGPDRGQSIEFVRDDDGRVKWIRVVGRAAVRQTLTDRAVPFEGDWRIVPLEHFDMTFRTAANADLERVAAIAERAYGRVNARLAYDLSLRPLVVVYATRADRERAIATRTFPGNREHLLWALDVPAAQAEGDFGHELTHIFSFDIVPPGVRDDVPRWLQEGLAELERSEWSDADRAAVRAWLSGGGRPTLEMLSRDPSTESRAATPVGRLAIEFLTRRAGSGGPARLLKALRETRADPYQVYLDTVGLARTDFDRQFTAYAEGRVAR